MNHLHKLNGGFYLGVSGFFLISCLFDFCLPQPRQESVCWALAGIRWIGIPGGWGELLLACKLRSNVESCVSEARSPGKIWNQVQKLTVCLSDSSVSQDLEERGQEVGGKWPRQKKEAEWFWNLGGRSLNLLFVGTVQFLVRLRRGMLGVLSWPDTEVCGFLLE